MRRCAGLSALGRAACSAWFGAGGGLRSRCRLERGRVDHTPRDPFAILVARHVDGAETLEVDLLILAIDQREAAVEQVLAEMSESQLAGMVLAAEHALHGEHRA